MGLGLGLGLGLGSPDPNPDQATHHLVEGGGVLGVRPPLVPPLRLEVVRLRVRG